MTTTNRFDNIPTADLIINERNDRDALRELQETIKARMIVESGIAVGKVYRVASTGTNREYRLAGRLMLVEGVNAGLRGSPRHEEFYCFAWGRMNGRSTAGDGWTIRRQQVDVTRLTLHHEGEP